MIGIALHGLLPFRARDVVGLAWSRLDLAGRPGRSLAGSESALEAFYRLQLGDRSDVQLGVQFVDGPGGGGQDDAVVIGMRSTITF